MSKRVHIAICIPATALGIAVLIVGIVGCESKQAGVTAGSTNDQLNSTLTAASQNSAAKPRPKLQPGAKTKALARAGDRSYDKSFDDLRFEMTPGGAFHRSMLTKDIEAMHGQRIRIRGFILPTPQHSGIKTFVLVRDNQECCFGPGAALYDCILVDMKPGKSTEFSIRPVTAEGTFEIREFVIGGKHMAIYHMDAESAG